MKRARTLTAAVVLAAGTALGSCDSGPKAGEIVAEIVTPAVELGAAQPAIKLVLISGFLFITTPASTHAIARAAPMSTRRRAP